jgi:parvulin-like peptidyl-prolyl isomerase
MRPLLEDQTLPDKDQAKSKEKPEKDVKKSKLTPKAVKSEAEKPKVASDVSPDIESKSEAPKQPEEKDPFKASDEKSPAAAEAVGSSEPASKTEVAQPLGPNKELRGLAMKITAVVVGIVALVILVFGVLIYAYKSESSVVKTVAGVIPYPVERVNGHFVSYHDYLFEVDANERAYQNNAKLNNQPAVDFKSKDGKKLVQQIKQHSLDKLKSDTLVAQLAGQKNVKVTDKEVNDLINQLYQRYGGKDTLLKTLNQIYGWDLNDLKSVVRKQLLAKDLQDKVTNDPAVDKQAKGKAEDVLKKIKDGGDFAALAKQYSQASDASSGGDLGFFTKGQLPDNEQAAAEALQPDQVSDVLKTQYGYEIIKVIEKKDDGSIHAQHILIKTVDFNEWFQSQLTKAKTSVYIKV